MVHVEEFSDFPLLLSDKSYASDERVSLLESQLIIFLTEFSHHDYKIKADYAFRWLQCIVDLKE